MLDAYKPVSQMLALWPTHEFEFPAAPAELGQRLREQFPVFDEMRLVEMAGGGTPPPELARAVLLGEGRQWALELAPAKLSLRRTVNAPDTLERLFERLRELWLPMQAWMAENHNLRVYRLGLVTQLFCHTRSSANEKIAHYFLQPRALQGQLAHEVHLDLLARLPLAGGTMVNRWLRLRPLRTADPRRLDFAAQVEVDINTLAEDTQVRTVRDVQSFLEAALHHIGQEIPMLSDEDFLS